MLKVEESCQAVSFASVSREGLTREISMKLSTWRIFKYDFLTLHPYYIYSHYPQKYERPFQREKPQIGFLQHNTPIFQRDSYSSLVRNHFSLFSFPFPLSYLERRFVSKHNLYLIKVQRVFWNLGSFGDLPKKAGKVWRMQSGVLRDPKSQRRHDSEKSVGSRNLEGSSTWGRLNLEGFLLFVYSNFILQWIHFNLEGHREDFRLVLQFPLR